MMVSIEFIEAPFFCGIGLLLVGVIMYFFPPRKINSFYGYRTPASMKSDGRWHFAQKYSATKMVFSGIVLVLISFISAYFEVTGAAAKVLSVASILGAIFLMMYLTEKAISKKFPNKN